MHMSLRELREANLVGALALEISDRLRDAVLDEGERSMAAAAALVHVRLRPGESIELLSHVLGVSHAAAVRLVDRLEEQKLVERRPGADGRTRALHLTRRGTKAAERALRDRARRLEEVLAPLTERERRTFAALAAKLLAAAARDRRTARHTCRLCDFPACAHPACPIDVALGNAASIRVAPVAPVAP
jgi:MarR family transcriptional regulator, negative regulator of the multidrug operon emrRAB